MSDNTTSNTSDAFNTDASKISKKRLPILVPTRRIHVTSPFPSPFQVVSVIAPITTPMPMPIPVPITTSTSTTSSVASVTPGKIRVGQCQMMKKYPSALGFQEISAWSRGKSEFRPLSPFFLGPLVLDGEQSENFENGWQHLKVYEQHLDKANNDLPNGLWKTWRTQGFRSQKAVRRPMGKEKPIYCFFKGKKLLTVEARIQIYIPFYKELVRKTAIYQVLLKKLRAGQSLFIIEPDGPNLAEFPEGVEISRELFQKLIKVTDQKSFYDIIGKPFVKSLSLSLLNKYFPLGHGYVLADALLEDL